jgi:hypothetical protein
MIKAMAPEVGGHGDGRHWRMTVSRYHAVFRAVMYTAFEQGKQGGWSAARRSAWKSGRRKSHHGGEKMSARIAR